MFALTRRLYEYVYVLCVFTFVFIRLNYMLYLIVLISICKYIYIGISVSMFSLCIYSFCHLNSIGISNGETMNIYFFYILFCESPMWIPLAIFSDIPRHSTIRDNLTLQHSP